MGSVVAMIALLLAGLAVQGVVEDQWHSHSGVVWVTTESWRGISHAQQDVIGTVLDVLGDENTEAYLPSIGLASRLPSQS